MELQYIIKYVKGIKGIKQSFYAGKDKDSVIRFIKENDEKRELHILELTKSEAETIIKGLEKSFVKATFELVEVKAEMTEEQIKTADETI